MTTTTIPRRTCLVCRRALERRPKGPPPTYCSTACRRTAEYEIRRINAWLEHLEAERHRDRLRLAEYAVSPPGGSAAAAMTQARLEANEAEIAEKTERLRALLSGNEEASSPGTGT